MARKRLSLYQSGLFPDEDMETLNAVRAKEYQIRVEVKVTTDKMVLPNFPSLLIPTRWEALQEQATLRNVPLKSLIQPVYEAIKWVERELRSIEETAMGKLFVVSGATGSDSVT